MLHDGHPLRRALRQLGAQELPVLRERAGQGKANDPSRQNPSVVRLVWRLPLGPDARERAKSCPRQEQPVFGQDWPKHLKMKLSLLVCVV
ncbi:hypothetical protein AA102526_2292 [Asaia lannensis NBRC 102526]|nr:hypothetical protein AA102526_2292 [Asaia lannensis NBRC 102526]